MKTLRGFLKEAILTENIEDRHSEAWYEFHNHVRKVKSAEHRKKFRSMFKYHHKNFSDAHERDDEDTDEDLSNALGGMHEVIHDVKTHVKNQK